MTDEATALGRIRAEAAERGGPKPDKKPRLNVEVPQSVNDSVTRLTAQLEITKTELLRRAINLLEIAVDETAKGHQLTIADKDLKVITRIVGI